jgi:hypothetical protein
VEPRRDETNEKQPAGFPRILYLIPVAAILIGQLLMGLYEDDTQSALNAGLPIGLALTAIGVIFLAVFAVIACVRAFR